MEDSISHNRGPVKQGYQESNPALEVWNLFGRLDLTPVTEAVGFEPTRRLTSASRFSRPISTPIRASKLRLLRFDPDK
jgi:hypothetical protein